MITLSTKAPFLHSVPDVLKPFRKAGKVDDIFRPRIVGNGVFATTTGYAKLRENLSWRSRFYQAFERGRVNRFLKQRAFAIADYWREKGAARESYA